MNPFEQMQIKQGAFTATDQQVYEAFINNVDAVLRASATSLAEDFGISQPAITRFCQKLGYRGSPISGPPCTSTTSQLARAARRLRQSNDTASSSSSYPPLWKTPI